MTLEPCSHVGRTPPCCDALVAAGLGRVVVGILDPAPWVAGNGIERIRAAGLAVDVGVEAAACAAINADWIAGVVGLPDDVVDDPTADGAVDPTGGFAPRIGGLASRARRRRASGGGAFARWPCRPTHLSAPRLSRQRR